MVTLNSEGTAKDIGVELFSEDTGEQFMFYVGIVVIHRCKSLGRKSQLDSHLEGGQHLCFLGCINLDS